PCTRPPPAPIPAGSPCIPLHLEGPAAVGPASADDRGIRPDPSGPALPLHLQAAQGAGQRAGSSALPPPPAACARVASRWSARRWASAGSTTTASIAPGTPGSTAAIAPATG